MFVSVRMRLRNHVDTQPVKRVSVKRAMKYIYKIKFGMIQVHENKISLRKWSGGN